MALTAEEKQQILDLLDKLERESTEEIIANEQSFTTWLRKSLPDVYRKIKDSIQSVLNWLRERFK